MVWKKLSAVHVSTSVDFGKEPIVSELEPDLADLKFLTDDRKGLYEITSYGQGTLEYPNRLDPVEITPQGQAMVLLNRSKPGEYIMVDDRKNGRDWVLLVTPTGLMAPDGTETEFVL